MNTELHFLRGLESALPSVAVDGTFYLTTDSHRLFVGQGEALVPVNEGVVTVANVDALPDSAIPGSFYYAAEENILCVHNGQIFVQINADTGMTSIEIVGEGNAITDASYDAGTRKLTLTKGATYATQEALETLTDNVSTLVANSGGAVYQVTSDSLDIDVLAAGITPKAGDVLVVTSSVNDVKSGYHYDKEDGWVAMDGNVAAEKVILKDNITMAGNYTQVGNLSKTSSGTATFETAGKSVAEALTEIFSKRLQPGTPTQPAVSLTFSQAKAYEVGTEVTPSYSASLSAGSYTYGPATGITATSWNVTDTNGNSATTASGSFEKFTVGDSTSYTITAKADHEAGTVAKDNLGSDSNPVVQIAAGTKSKTSGAVTGYRSFFYGVLSTSSVEAPLTSAIIRGMTNGGAYNGSKSFTLNGSATAKRMVIAIPGNSTRGGLSEVILTSAMNTPITDSYVKTEDAVVVEGVNGYSGISYDVYVYEPASIDAGEVHEIKLA